MSDLPTGTVTFLFTDIEGSTRLLQQLGDRYAGVLAEFRQLLRTLVQERGGKVVDTQGDALFVAFQSAKDAVAAAVAAQRALIALELSDGASLRVRMGLHTGEALATETGYVGMGVHRAARICAAGHGGQILLSQTTRDIIEERPMKGVTLRDLGEHRLKDLGQAQHLYQVMTPDLSADFPALKSLDVRPHNLPVQLTSFVGRDQEMADVKKLLTSARLLTLTGAGGSGKTRLALQVAANAVEEFADGACLVELAALSDSGLVPQTVASTLKISDQPGRPVTEALADYLRRKSLLLVLDNCEHLVDACAGLAETLLQTCPGLRILATSREALNIAGEMTFRVPSLSLPELQPVLSTGRVVLYEAVRLFVDRALLAQPSFALTDRNAPLVAHVVRRLDGIPLAIELAAARMKVLSVEEIAARLDDQFRLLTGGRRTALPRHQTLRAAMDWSYDLLSEEERALLRRLSVFAGGWTLEEAEAVCAGNGLLGQDVLDLLAHLTDKSLIIVEEGDAGTRYRQLETVRQYSRDRLVASGEASGVQRRHRDWFLRLAEGAEPELLGADQASWFNRLDLEHDNLRTGLAWSLESGEVEAALRLAIAVTRFWLVRGYSEQGLGWLQAGLENSSGLPTSVRAKALQAAGNLAVQGQADYATGRASYEASLALWRELGDRKGIANLLSNLGLLALYQGDQARARALIEENLAMRRAAGDRWGIAVSLNNLGLAVTYGGDYAMARSLLDEALALWRELGDKRSIALALTNLGLVAARGGEHAAALALYQESLTIRRELGDKWGIAFSLEGLAGVAAAQGLPKRAARLLGAVEALRETIHAPLPPVYRTEHESRVAAARSRLNPEAFVAAWMEGRAMTLEQAISDALATANVDREEVADSRS